MAQKTRVWLVDDIDGTEATETVSFGLDGATYEIDLSADHSGDIHAKLVRYVEHARKVGPVRPTPRAGNGGGRRTRDYDSGEIRARLRELGYEVKDRGRVPADLVEKAQRGIRNPEAQPAEPETALPVVLELPADPPAEAAVTEEPQVKRTRKPKVKEAPTAAFSG